MDNTDNTRRDADTNNKDALNQFYRSPDAELVTEEYEEVDIPQKILDKIKGGVIVATISAIATAIFVTISIISGTSVGSVDAWSSIDVVLILALAYGIYKRSRFAAVSMLLYFILSKVLIFLESQPSAGNIVALIFIYYYTRATIGTFQYHKFIATLKQSDNIQQ